MPFCISSIFFLWPFQQKCQILFYPAVGQVWMVWDLGQAHTCLDAFPKYHPSLSGLTDGLAGLITLPGFDTD